MTDNISARAATAGELVKFRTPGDFTKLGLAIQRPVTVYTARINQTFTSLDGVYKLTYDAGSGTLADVLKNMLVFIGSAAGLYDKGICRVRQLPTLDTLYISQTSHIQFADNDFITIVDAMPILQRDITNAGGDVLMDYDIAFGDLDNGGAIPRIGPLVSVLKLVAGTVTFTPPSPALSACYDGATIVSYLYDFPGAVSTANLTSGTGTANATYDTAGEYRWSCTITDSLGRVTTAYRWTFVDPTPIDFTLEDCSGDFDSGDWSFEVSCSSGVTRADIHDRALVALYGDREVYNNVTGSIGKIAGYENIKCAGWIDGESITYDLEGGVVSFTVHGPMYWLSKLRAFPFDLQDTSSAPTTWKQIQEMTIDKALAHILYWTSTAPTVMDCFFTGNTIRKKVLVEPGGSLAEQINAIAANTIFAKPIANNYGQLYIEIDQQLIPDADRDALPVVMDITNKDWGGPLDIERNTTPHTSMLELGAVSDYDGATSAQVHSRAPGNIGKTYGDASSYNNYVVLDQNECNRIAGALLAMENNEYEPLEINFSTNNSLIDIAPRQYCTISIASGDTERGIVLTSARLIPRKVSYEYDKDKYALSTNVTFEFEAIGVDGIEYHPPTVLDNNLDMGMDDFGSLDFPGLDGFFSPTVPPDVTIPCNSAIGNSYSLTWAPRVLTGSTTTLIAKALFPCKIRANGGTKETTIDIAAGFSGDARAHVNIYGVKDGARVITGSWVGNQVTFSTISDLEVDSFEIELDAGEGAVIQKYAPGNLIEIGDSGVPCTKNTDANAWYCIEGYAGHWYTNTPPWGTAAFYNFRPYGGYVSDLNGGVGYSPAIPGMALDVVYPYVFAEAVNTLYGRIYFKGTTTVTFTPNSSFAPFAATAGFRWALREAQAIGRQLRIGSSMLNNVCGIV